MSIIINALRKADKNKNRSKKADLKKLLGLRQNNRPAKRRGFLVGLFIGCFLMFFVLACIVVAVLLWPEKPSSDIIIQATQIDANTVVPVNTASRRLPIEDLIEIDRELDQSDLGLDVEDEMMLEKILREDSNIAKQQPAETYINNIPVENKIATLRQQGLPDLIISGVIWDFERKYVFIDGIPYRENDVYQDVAIKKIALTHIVVQYDNNEYEIIIK